MQYNRPLRRTNLQLLHIVFTLARTFTDITQRNKQFDCVVELLVIRDPLTYWDQVSFFSYFEP